MNALTCSVAVLVSLVLIGCGSGSNPANPSVTASETWRLNDVGTQSYANLTLTKLSDGGMGASGSWYYTFYGNTITCAFMHGSAVGNAATDSVVINGNGTASYPPDSSGQAASSAFALQMRGVFKDGTCSGRWSITFSDSLWNGWVSPGSFRGKLQSGSGVTAP